jgi:hypothetical protein
VVPPESSCTCPHSSFVRGLSRSNVDDFVGVANGVPTGAIAEVGKQRMNAGVDLRLSDFVVDLAAMYGDGVKRIYRNLPELWAAVGNLEADGAIVADISHGQQGQNR